VFLNNVRKMSKSPMTFISKPDKERAKDFTIRDYLLSITMITKVRGNFHRENARVLFTNKKISSAHEILN